MAKMGKRPPGSVEKAKDFKGTLTKLIDSLSIYKKSIIIVIIFAIISTVFSILGPKILGNAITEIFNGIVNKLSNNGSINFDNIAYILILLLILYIISSVFNYIQSLIMTNISQKYSYELRKKISKKINKLPISYFDKKTHGEVLSVITNDVDTISNNLNQSITEAITCVVTVLGVLIMMLTINVKMTLISLTILPVSLLIVGFIVGKSQKYFEQHQEYLATVNGEVEEIISGQNVIKVFNAEDKMYKKFMIENNKLADSAWKSQFTGGIMFPLMNFLGNIGYVMVAIFGGYFCVKGQITVGNIQSFISYTKNFTRPIGQLAQISNMIQSTIAACERVFEFLDSPEEEKTKIKKYDITKIKGNIEFKNVKFGYTKDKIIINDFSAKVKSGQKIAIVGPTGAGKTTMVKLLMRFYNINEGKILIDNKDINTFDKDQYRQLFGMVLQDTWLFNGSIMDNLRYGKLDASDEDVIKAAKMANVHHFIQTLSHGYDTEINEETNNISGGQKQLLTIARAILADPKVLILDEATSSVDTRTEVLIQNAMDKLMKGRTSFIIAHRLSTIKNADLILVMDKGDIVEQGTHEELLKKDGFYAKLYNSQFEQK